MSSSLAETLAPPLHRRPWRRQVATGLASASRVGLWGLASFLVPRARGRPSPEQGRVMRYFWRRAFDLHRELRGREEVARALNVLERRDLRDLPLFALSLPFDLWRARRKQGGAKRPVRADDAFPYPDYYLHDFHNQLNGGLSRRAAATYEWQIRCLFLDTNRLMRQRVVDALPQGSGLQILDVGCGAAAWLPQARMQGRDHAIHGIDLSPYYLARARALGVADTTFTQMNAEDLPAAWAGRFDRVVAIWLFHELPAAARRRVTANMARVLKRGGEVLFMDAIQQADVPHLDIARMNADFARDFDEPHFAGYQDTDLTAHFAQAGLAVRERGTTFVSNFYRLTKS